MLTAPGFVLPIVPLRPPSKPVPGKSQPLVMTALPSRRAFISFTSSALLVALPLPSHALSREEAEQGARLAYASLPQLFEMVDLEDYDGFRRQLRTGAMSRVRASCNAWYRSFETTDQRAVAGEKMYKGLIKAIEAADYAALKAERGGDGAGVGELVRSIGLRFDEFLGAVSG